jgi:hypothetical protein
MTMTFDTGLLITRVVGSVFAGVYGLYATVTDLYKTESGKRSLSRKGKVGLLLLLLATVINVGSDAVKQKRDLDSSRHDAVARDAETARIQEINGQVGRELAVTAETSSTLKSALAMLGDTSKIVSQNAKETNRLLDPIQNSMYLVANFSLPLDQPLVRPYADRVHQKDGGFPQPNSEGENRLYQFLTGNNVDIIFSKDAGTKILVFQAECRRTDNSLFTILTGFHAPNLSVGCTAIARKGADDGSFRSNSDLLSADVRLVVRNAGLSLTVDSVTLEAWLTEGTRAYTDKRFRLVHIRQKYQTPNDTAYTAGILRLPPGRYSP